MLGALASWLTDGLGLVRRTVCSTAPKDRAAAAPWRIRIANLVLATNGARSRWPEASQYHPLPASAPSPLCGTNLPYKAAVRMTSECMLESVTDRHATGTVMRNVCRIW